MKMNGLTNKLEPIEGEIPEINAESRTLKLRCVGKGEALWARFDLLYPVIITSRQMLGSLPNGAKQDCEIMAVRVAGAAVVNSIPGHVSGRVDIILQSKGCDSIELVLSARIEPKADGDAASAESVAGAIAELESQFADETAAAAEPKPEDPPPRPAPVDPRSSGWADTPMREPAPVDPRSSGWADTPMREVLPDAPLQTATPFDGVLPIGTDRYVARQFEAMMRNPNLDEATRRSIDAFMAADGDPSLMEDAPTRRRKPEPA